jgi:peptidylprolyl isomerase
MTRNSNTFSAASTTRLIGVALLCGCFGAAYAADAPAPAAAAKKAPSTAEILEASKPSDWRAPDPENTLYLDFASGRVVIELAPEYAPKHVANVKALAREGYFDGLVFLRSQDNYVVQWGDPNGDDKDKQRSIKNAQRTLQAEFDRPWAKGLSFTALGNVDGYAPEGGFSGGFPAARDVKNKRAWLAHCYGMLGAGRGNTADSGGGTELYIVIGNAPRHLDRNVTLLGRVLKGMELLSVLPRGSGPLGFYEKPEQHVPIKSIKVAADVPEAERVALEVMRTDTAAFADLIESRRNRREDWFLAKSNYVELCNVPIPVRSKPAS